jgi:hypothetical protein
MNSANDGVNKPFCSVSAQLFTPENWKVLFLGKLLLGLEFIDQRIQQVQLDDWAAFERVLVEETVDFALVMLKQQEEELWLERMQRLESYHLEKGLLFGVVHPNQAWSEALLKEFRRLAGYAFGAAVHSRAQIYYSLSNLYKIDTHAERFLLEGQLVADSQLRRAIHVVYQQMNRFYFMQQRKWSLSPQEREDFALVSVKLRQAIKKQWQKQGIPYQRMADLAAMVGVKDTHFLRHCWQCFQREWQLNKPKETKKSVR